MFSPKLLGTLSVLFRGTGSVFQKKCTVAYQRIPSHPNLAVHFFRQTVSQDRAHRIVTMTAPLDDAIEIDTTGSFIKVVSRIQQVTNVCPDSVQFPQNTG